MKKILAIILAAMMVLSVLAACQPSQPSSSGPNNSSDPSGTKPVEENATYTYNTATTIFAASWNPHTYEESTAGDMLDYLTDGFYSFDYNEDETGFAMVPAMTTDEHPVDITSEYIGKWGIKEGDANLVYKINLRDDLYWDNGDKITAHDYVESAKRLLNPAAKNYRADTMYTGDVVIYNAENYFKQGSTGTTSLGNVMAIEGFADVDALLAKYGESLAGINWYYSFGGVYDPATQQWGAPTKNAVEVTTMKLSEMVPFFVQSAMEMNGATEAQAQAWVLTELYIGEYTIPEMTMEQVGIFALSDTELVYVLTSPMEGFYLKYGMPSGYLVHIPTYDACQKIDEAGIYSSTYYTSVETSPSYGAYSLTKYQDKKEIEYTRNEKWYGLKEEGTYQTTHINVQYVENAATRLNLLKEGKLDIYGLTADDFEEYGKSDHTYYSEGASTFAMTFNPDLAALQTAQAAAGENKNKTIITLIEFRQAMAFGMDRPAFTAATDPAGVTAFGLFTNQHIVDPELGLGYRSTEQAKDVLVNFWGVADEIGEGKLYANKDEAIASLTGYNPEMAKSLFDAAYDKAIAEGLMDADDVIEIKIGMPVADSTFYNNGYNFIENHYKALVKGTKLENKLTFTVDNTLGENYNTALQSGQVDMLFGVGWSGMELNPYGLIMAYMMPQYQYDASTDYTAQMMTVTLSDGQVLTASVNDWYYCINGQPIAATNAAGEAVEYVCGSADGKYEDRLTILAAMENAVLMNYCFIPLNGDAGAQLKGMQLKYYHEEYMFGMGFGGIKYMTYNYTDAEWEAYVASQNGELNYT